MTDTSLNLAPCLPTRVGMRDLRARGFSGEADANFALAAMSHLLFCKLVPTISQGMIVKRRSFTATNHATTPTAFTPAGLHFFDPFQLRLARPVEAGRRGGSRFHQSGNQSNMSGDSDSGGSRCSGLLWL